MKVIITGATGMVGEGVLIECLQNQKVKEVLSVSRRATGISHPKLTEYIVADFLTLPENDEKLAGYDSCFFCAGISSVGVSEDDYRRITYDTTLHFARAMGPSPGKTFIYVSGGGTDSSEKGRMAWARIKGKTENDLMKLPFRQAFGFRIGFIIPFRGQKRVLKYYRYVSWLIPAIRLIAPNIICTISEAARAMIFVAMHGNPGNVIMVKEIKKMAAKLGDPT